MSERNDRVTELRNEGKAEEAMREAGWTGNIKVTEVDSSDAEIPYVGPLAEALTDVIVSKIKGWQAEGVPVDLDRAIMLLKLEGEAVKDGNGMIGGLIGVHGEAASPDDFLDALTDAINRIIAGTEYQNPFDRMVAIEKIDQELVATLMAVVALADEDSNLRGPFRTLRYRLRGQAREQKLVSAVNEWSRALKHVLATGEVPTGDTEVEGLEEIKKSDFGTEK